MRIIHSTTFLLFLLLITVASAAKHKGLVESERIQEYHNRNYSWPIENYMPRTPGWKKLMESRFAQVAELSNMTDRYQGYIQTLYSASLVPNFTEHGFGLARCPEKLINDLRKGIRDGVRDEAYGYEPKDYVIDGPTPWLIHRPDLTRRVLDELRNYAETWAGVELTPFRAYGFRLYRNESALWMHVDRIQTHIISFILHIDSSNDAEPWPIFMEDYQGRTHEVILTPGDILFYESAKCLHGRPRRFNGTWYSSVFAHYYPKYGWNDFNHDLESHYAVPPIWSFDPNGESQYEQLEMVGSSMREPQCPDNWCRAQDTVKWSGPAKEGYWIDPLFQKHEFHPEWHDEL
jgi:hypothetical protein